MIKIVKHGIELWQFQKLLSYDVIHHGVTGRVGGVSKGLYESLNFSFKSGDVAENVHKNIRILGTALGIDSSRILFPQQSHTCDVKIVDQNTSTKDLTDIDALITNISGICIGVLAADCVPVLLYDPRMHVIAAFHAGWRGTIGNIAEVTIKTMKEKFQCMPTDLIACIGPAIGKDNYPVGNEVTALFTSKFKEADQVVLKDAGNSGAKLDLCKANSILLQREGILDKNIEISGVNTFQNPSSFFSARRDSNNSGRFANYIFLT